MTLGARRLASDPGSWLRWSATGAWLLAIAAIGATVAVYLGRGPAPQPTGLVQGPLGVSAIALTGLLYASVGAFLVRRHARDPIGWALLAIGIGMAVILPLDQFVEASIHSFRSIPTQTLLVAWALTSIHMPASGSAAVLVMLLFPTRALDWQQARATLALAVGGAVLLAVSSAVRPEGLLWYPTLPNPLATPSAIGPAVALVSLVGVGAFVASLGLGVACLAWRSRTGDRRLRRPLALVALGAGAMAGLVAMFYIGRYAGTVSSTDGETLAFVAAVGASLLPLTIVRYAAVVASHGQTRRDLTFLFTDLTDSTAMYANVGDVAAFDLVRLHFDTLAEVAERNRGEIVKTIGDALMARFTDPADAVRAALEMFGSLERFNRENSSELVLKVGIHRGDAIVVSGRYRTDYFGQTVNVASRMLTVAAPGELVLSDAVWQGDHVAPLLDGYAVREESATLKGVSGEVLVHRLRPHAPDAVASTVLVR
jgi:class 3 adenylate cyclase